MDYHDIALASIKHHAALGLDKTKRATPRGGRDGACTNRPRLDFSLVAGYAAGNWPMILMQSGIAADYLTRKHGKCPGCGGRDRFRFDDLDGRGTFVCGRGGDQMAGDGFALLAHVHGWHTSEALRFVADVLGLQAGAEAPARRAQPPKAAQTPVDRSEAVRRIWRTASPLTGDCAGSRYLQGRGLTPTSYSTLRAHPALPYWHDGQEVHTSAALVGIAQDVHGIATGIQRIWLDGNSGKAIIEHDGEQLPCKKMLSRHGGAMAGAAVRLGEPADGRLIVAEGIETGLACRELWPAWPVWCALSTSGMKSLQMPENVLEVVIAADHDANQAGEIAAKALADRLTADGAAVKIALPPMVGDWLDVLNGKEASHVA
ncbi:hypothetical protein GZH52_02700 [Crenobacter sp. HX-7-9]|uniref:DNA primase/helicase Gp4 N-terminal Bacteriophage T7-like domain-containing protein n=2 Tax=Crenobacter caeni TaxID=2705474 RepID=A0A6B2KNH3_9NEIS|nr:hypothetical protein [Crenobacter caeni]